jgi:6-phosphogluconolactonase
MSEIQLHRYPDSDSLVTDIANRLLEFTKQRQQDQETVNLCLSDGPLVFKTLQVVVKNGYLDLVDRNRIDIWWSYELFRDETNTKRNSIQFLAQFGKLLPAYRVHPMPTSTGFQDPEEAAYAYSRELKGKRIDLCLFSMLPDGRIAGFARSVNYQFSEESCIALPKSPTFWNGESESVTLSMRTINSSDNLWIMAAGSDSASSVRSSLSDDRQYPGAWIHGTQETQWFIDEPAAAELELASVG